MKKLYNKLVVYRPLDNVVTNVRLLTYEESIDCHKSDRAFNELYSGLDSPDDMIIGITIGREYVQLAKTPYGYIKEDSRTMEPINKSKLLCAISSYHKRTNTPFSLQGL